MEEKTLAEKLVTSIENFKAKATVEVILPADEQREWLLAKEVIAEKLVELDAVEKLREDAETKLGVCEFELAKWLHLVNKKKLYRAEYGSWEGFLSEPPYERSTMWGYHMVAHYELCLFLNAGDPIGLTERQARPLTRLLKFPDELRALWNQIKHSPTSFDLSDEVRNIKDNLTAKDDEVKEAKAKADDKRYRIDKKNAKVKEENVKLKEEHEAAQNESAKAKEVRAKQVEEEILKLDDEIEERFQAEPDRDKEEIIAEMKDELEQDILEQEKRKGEIENLTEAVFEVCSWHVDSDIDFDREYQFEGMSFRHRVQHWMRFALEKLDAEIEQVVAEYEASLPEEDEPESDEGSDEDEDEEDEDEGDDAEDEADAEAEIRNLHDEELDD